MKPLVHKEYQPQLWPVPSFCNMEVTETQFIVQDCASRFCVWRELVKFKRCNLGRFCKDEELISTYARNYVQHLNGNMH